MKIYLGIKFYDDNSNKVIVDGISSRLEELGHSVFCVARDLEKWGEKSFTPKELMQNTFEEIDKSDAVVIEFSEKGVGLGIESGYAYGKNIPIYVVANNGSSISSTMKGIAHDIFFYKQFSEININL